MNLFSSVTACKRIRVLIAWENELKTRLLNFTGSPDARFRATFGVCGSIGTISDELDVVCENLQRIEKDISKETMNGITHLPAI